MGRFTYGVRALVLLGTCCLVAGCGGTAHPSSSSADAVSPGGSGSSAQYAHAVKFAHCMRANGVSQFPDPRNPGGFSTGALAAINTSAPAFIKASGVCQKLLPNDGEPTAADIEQAVQDGLQFAKCMRKHGVYFPDPTLVGSQLAMNLANVNTNSPKYTRVGKLCATKPGG